MTLRSVKSHVKAVVKAAEGAVSIRTIGDSDAVVANVLGRKTQDDGTETLWLDRLVHRPFNDTIGDGGIHWKLSGCFVTEMTGPYQGEPASK